MCKLSAFNQSGAKWKGTAWSCMWGVIRATLASAQFSLCDEQPAVLKRLNNPTEDKQFWTVQFMSASALFRNIDKSFWCESNWKESCALFLKWCFLIYANLVLIKNALWKVEFCFGFLSSARNLVKWSFQQTEAKSIFIWARFTPVLSYSAFQKYMCKWLLHDTPETSNIAFTQIYY